MAVKQTHCVTGFSSCKTKMDTSRNAAGKKPVRLIAAASRNMGIGKDGKLPWHLPSEIKFFLQTVTSVSRPGQMNMLVWGRRTWFSNPDFLFPMENVLHVVLSKTLSTVPDHAHSLHEDLRSVTLLATQPPLADLIETIWIVGGSQVYQEALTHPWCDLVYLTDVMAHYDCDVFFPQLDRRIFKAQIRFPGIPSGIQEENGIKYEFQVFKKELCDAM
ncbi:dihydrofolate reductase [Genypterus blacodes]|uniref:dihydrofolate reductase n=1 Tax=Genypterus blacodes TaxID=154954 RepID=UPI003F7672BF